MMETYVIYSATGPGGEPEFMAIHADIVEQGDYEPSAYFNPGFEDVREAGRVEIEGDTHLLAEYFSVR